MISGLCPDPKVGKRYRRGDETRRGIQREVRFFELKDSVIGATVSHESMVVAYLFSVFNITLVLIPN